jgi:hypothetical protein
VTLRGRPRSLRRYDPRPEILDDTGTPPPLTKA